MITEDLPIIIILTILGLLLIVFGIYLLKVTKSFKNKGIDTKFKVINTKVESQYDANNNKIGEFYLTTFKFTYDNKELTETIQTRQKFSEDSIIVGKYLPNATLNKISVANEGFSIPNKVSYFIIIIGILLLLTAIIFIF